MTAPELSTLGVGSRHIFNVNGKVVEVEDGVGDESFFLTSDIFHVVIVNEVIAVEAGWLLHLD